MSLHNNTMLAVTISIAAVSTMLTVPRLLAVNKVNSVTTTNLQQVTMHNNELNKSFLLNKLEDDNYNIMFNSLYVDEDSNSLVLEPMYDSKQLNEIIQQLDTLDKFNEYLSTLIYDSSPIYNSPVVNDSNKINCFGLTLLAMSYLDTYYSDQYYYKVITDKQLPHVYLHLYHKDTGQFIRKVDLTVQDKLEFTKE